MKTAFIILNYQTYQLTLKLIESIYSNKILFKGDLIIVIDNNSKNDSANILKYQSKKMNFILLINPLNNGYSAGNNLGIIKAKSLGCSHVMIINNDVEFFPNTNFYQHLRNGFKNKNVAITCPSVYTTNGKLVPHFYIRPNFFLLSIGYYLYRLFIYIKSKPSKDIFIFKPSGCCMLIDIEKFQQIDFFDEDIFLYFEEDIIGEKFFKTEYKIQWAIKSRITHAHSKTVKSNISNFQIRKIKNKSMRIYLQKYLSYSNFKASFVIFFHNLISILRG